MKSIEIRKLFFSFFQKQGHTLAPSSPVIPADDPTLLFTNAGMNQFKELFLGREQRSYTRAVTIQKCIRAGGKHNDLDNVGFTNRHLTFFEMMGNFSFGDYFKKDAIRYAWEFLTQSLQLDTARLWVSVYEEDAEAYALWNSDIGLPATKIVQLGARDNFWQMGDTGPCGPCSEIYVDRGIRYGCGTPTCAPGCSCDRFLEIWNLVFMQFDRQKNGTDIPLAKPGVDTGMGLDRLCAVLQNAESVFETDLFRPIIAQIESITGISYLQSAGLQRASFHVLADHIRSTSFALADGCTPSAEGRGYVLRKIIRRASLFALKLTTKPLFPNLIDGLIASLGDIYPELKVQRNHIHRVLTHEVEQFSKNLLRGKNLLEEQIAKGTLTSLVPGSLAFTLYDTYGFPLELTRIIAQEHNLSVDIQEFDIAMEKQRIHSGIQELAVSLPLDPTVQTIFTGYECLEQEATITHLIVENLTTKSVANEQYCWIVTDQSPWYVAGGGQITDIGTVSIHGYTVPVLNALKQGQARAVLIAAPTSFQVGDRITFKIDESARRATMKNHTATHLLQAALIHTLGKTVKQAGSLVTPDYLRFDFSCEHSITTEQIKEVERFVNEAIQLNIPVTTQVTNLAQAQQAGVIAFFGEKYNPEHVRVVRVGSVSAELCGGTHVHATGEIGLFKITESTALAAGVRRVVALTGPQVVVYVQEIAQQLKTAAVQLKTNEHGVVAAVEKVAQQAKEERLTLRNCRKQLWKLQIPQWIAQTEQVNALSVGIVVLEGIPREELRELGNQLLNMHPGLWMLITTEQDHEQIAFLAVISKELSKTYSLKTLLQELNKIGMKGGGSDIAIQGSAAHMPESLKRVLHEWIQKCGQE